MDLPEIEEIAVPGDTGDEQAGDGPSGKQKTAGERIDRFLAAALPDLSRSRLKALITSGQVAAGGRTIVDPSYRVKPGETLTLVRPPAEDPEPKAENIPLEILFEDADLVVLVKPAGMVVHPAPGSPDGTLVNALLGHCGDSLSGIGGVRRPGIVHRLDKDTSGVMVAAKSDRAHKGLAALFETHDIQRDYLALVRGEPQPPKGTVDAPIVRDPRDRKRMAVGARGREAMTHYAIEQRFGGAATLVRCTLETGRTHQIRVHMAYLGYPVLGDPLYGRVRRKQLVKLSPAAADAVQAFPRQALHAAVLGFVHPVTGEDLLFEAPVPDDLAALIQVLEAPVEGSGR